MSPARRQIRILAFGLGLTLALAAIEIAPRLISPLAKLRPLPHTYVGDHVNRPNATMVVDPQTGWRMQPNLRIRRTYHGRPATYATNSQGFRSDIEFDAAGSAAKIVLAGDSFTFGVGVESAETFGALADRALERSVVYNLAMPGFGLDQMYLSVKHQALPLAPSLVVVSLINESLPRSLEAYRMTEGWNKPVFKLAGGNLVPKTSADRPGAIVRFLERHSVVWRASTLASRALAQSWPHGEEWRLNVALLRELRNTAAERQVPVLFVLIPTYHWQSFPALAKHLRETGADFVDLSQEPGLDMSRMYYPGDGHLNAAGHQWVSEVLVRRIRSKYPQL